jgi:endonuclease-3 related protein
VNPAADAIARLRGHYGPQHWWPACSLTEMMVGAVLTQNTAWTNVEKALAALRGAGLLVWDRLAALDEADLAAYIRPAGFFRIKARRLKALLDRVARDFGGDPTRLLALPVADARARLLDIHGIGPETADCILLYGGGHPVFVIDAYTRRVLHRHGWLDARASYDTAAAWFTDRLPPEATLFNEAHAWLVALGKDFCRPRPRCQDCPLAGLLPAGGPCP